MDQSLLYACCKDVTYLNSKISHTNPTSVVHFRDAHDERELTVRPGLLRCRDAAMSDSWTSGRSGVGLAAYEAER